MIQRYSLQQKLVFIILLVFIQSSNFPFLSPELKLFYPLQLDAIEEEKQNTTHKKHLWVT